MRLHFEMEFKTKAKLGESPARPVISTVQNQTAVKDLLQRAAKTPSQAGSLYQRNFRSEIQPNRVSSRFQNDNFNLKSSTRYHPPTSQHQLTRSNSETSSAPKSYLLSRLGNTFKHKDQVKRPNVLPPRTQQAPSASVLPANSFRSRSKSPVQATKTPAINPHEIPYQRRIMTQARSQFPTNTPAASFRQQPKTPLQLIDPQEIPNHRPYLPITTSATSLRQPPKTPLQPIDLLDLPFSKSAHRPQPTTTTPAASFRQQPKTPLQPINIQELPHTRYAHPTQTHQPPQQQQYQCTQPTPHSSNKSTHQISRAHSEPNITYQVRVNDKSYKILRKIGSGGSAKVYEGFEPLTAQSVAIKIINIAQAEQKTKESYFNERFLLTKLKDSKHVVRMYDSEYKKDCKELVIVMEKGDADLSQVIESYFRHKDCMIDGIFIKFYWRGMVQAVNSIHQRGIVHADLKPVNFILVKNEIKLIDFGIASAVDPEGTSVIRDYQIGTINYMAPEALRNRANDASFYSMQNDMKENDQHKKTIIKYNSKADIWSLGCILYNLVYGRPPFDRYKDIVSKVQAITNPRNIIEFPAISNQNLFNCMKSCLRHNPLDRPTAQDLLNDPYLKEDVVTLHE